MRAVEKGSPPRHAGQPTPFGPFVLERRLAVGGSAEVFLARPKVGRVPAAHLVVKRLLPSYRDEHEFDVLEHEAELHRSVVHENVVTVYGAGMVGQEPYLAMEYVEGVDLYRLLRRAEADSRRFPVGLATYIARNVGAALGAVHSARDATGAPYHIVHRDVTPSNVYLSVEGAVKLGDFGIARVRQRGPTEAKTASAGLKGKFGYLAPEQIAGEPFDHRADLFSLAVLLGELLIGERVFPGNGQLAVLLAIRDVNIEPLRRAAGTLPPGLFELLEKALARDPSSRYQDAASLCAALEPFEQPSPGELRDTLAEWVTWAQDSSQLAAQIEGRIRDSVQRMQAVRRASGRHSAQAPPARVLSGVSSVRCADGRHYDAVPLPRLIEMIAVGELDKDDQVALMGGDLRKIRDIDDLSRHLLPSTSAVTGRLFEPGVPDFRASLADSRMLDVLARMRINFETGAMFVERRDQSGVLRRKELYLQRGRLLHVASTDRAELLGEYLVRRGALTRAQLDAALASINDKGGRLGDTLVELGHVDAMDVFRAIRDQGRDRVAALCGWSRGDVSFYRETRPARVEFPLDLDLASPMMAGAYVMGDGDPRSLLPAGSSRIRPGLRADSATDREERGTSPISLQLAGTLAYEGVDVDDAIQRITAPRKQSNTRKISVKEACAALVTAWALGWIELG